MERKLSFDGNQYKMRTKSDQILDYNKEAVETEYENNN